MRTAIMREALLFSVLAIEPPSDRRRDAMKEGWMDAMTILGKLYTIASHCRVRQWQYV